MDTVEKIVFFTLIGSLVAIVFGGAVKVANNQEIDENICSVD